MRRTKTLLFGLLLGLVAYTYAESPAPEHSQLHVFVYDDVGTSASLLAGAEQAATRVFQRAGIAVSWVNCDRVSAPACATEILPGDLAVRIVPRGRIAQPGIFGVSFLDRDGNGSYADVFLDPIRKLLDGPACGSLVSILGDVMAHELGHLLLGSNAHAPQGIMQAHWESAQLRDVSAGRMLFTTAQGERLRSRIASARKAREELHPILTVNY